MTRSEAIAPHLPLLRRYARALTGRQSSGDSYVRACLETILANPETMPLDLSPRVALYQTFHAVWNSLATDPSPAGTEPTGTARSAEARMARLVPEQRQALLLSALEGFAIEDIAVILKREAREVQSLIDAALDDISRDIATGVLIIEDEPIIALDLSNIVEELGHHVTHVAATRRDAVAAARRRRPGLILADIQLADNSSGIEAVQDILGDGRVPVIFITAYPERLLTGERPEPTFLLTKPFLPDAVKAAVSQALFFYSTSGATTD